MGKKEAAPAREFKDTRVPARGAENKKWLEGRMKWPTGHCNENGLPGCHEGTKPRDFAGKPMMTCEFWQTCPCQCHKRIDDMFAMTGMERKLIVNPEYQPPVPTYVVPDFVADDPLGGDDEAAGPDTPDATEHTAPPPWVAPAAPLVQRRTETGRAAKGGLEAQVWDACRILYEEAQDSITPKIVGEWIAAKYKVPTPSSGAINAVWDRWTKLGFATQAKKPNRFVEFTGNPSWQHLMKLKSDNKRADKMNKAAQKRGFRPPA